MFIFSRSREPRPQLGSGILSGGLTHSDAVIAEQMHMRSVGTAVFGLLTAGIANVLLAQSPNPVAQPGAVVVEPPTTGAVGVEWRIQGDDNRNASVAVAWRRSGETTWRDGLPLLRLQGEAVQQGASFHYVAPNMFAGSVFDLAPDMTYDVRLRLTDPDAPAAPAGGPQARGAA